MVILARVTSDVNQAMTDISARALEQREQLRQDIRRSEELRATLRAKLARGKDEDLIAAWHDIEALDLDIAQRIRTLRPND